MYTYLRNIGPHFFMVSLFFLKSCSVGSKLRWLFHFCLLGLHLVILTSRKGLMSSYIFVLHPLSQELPILPDIFLRKGIMETALPCVFDCPPAWSCPSSVQLGFSLGWGYVKVSLGFLYNEMFSCKIFGTSKLFQSQKWFWYWFKINLFSKIQVIPMDRFLEVMKAFCFCLKMKVTSGWSQKV